MRGFLFFSGGVATGGIYVAMRYSEFPMIARIIFLLVAVLVQSYISGRKP